MTFQDYCELAGSPAAATLNACSSVPSDDVAEACAAFASPSTAVRVICLDIGFSAGTCADIAAGVPETWTCEILVGNQAAFCQGLADADDTESCAAWGPTAIIDGDTESFNDALTAMETNEMSLLQSACATVAGHTDAACQGHGIGHMCSMVPELRTDTCEEIADVAVGLAFCQAQGGPDNSVLELCSSVTGDADSMTAGCADIGIYEWSALQCSGFGYDYTTCQYVGALITGSIPLLLSDEQATALGYPLGTPWFTPFPQTLEDGSDGCAAFVADAGETVCPMLVEVDSARNGGDRADNCDDWAQNEGHNIGFGSQLAASLAPHTTDGTNFNDFCTAAGSPQAASNAACNGVPAENVAGACLQLGGPGPAVGMLCGQLGFSTETCAAIVEGIPEEVDTCDALVAAQPVLCQAIADGTTDADCDAWAPNGFIGGAPAALTEALAAVADDELALLAAGCASVVASADAACADHPTGHICAHVDLTGR